MIRYILDEIKNNPLKTTIAVAGAIVALMYFIHGTLPPAINSETANPVKIINISGPSNPSSTIIINNKNTGVNNSNVSSNPTVAIYNQPPLINELTSRPDSPQKVGTTIAWTTDATDPDGDQIFYEYILNGKPITGWSRDNAWTWQPSGQYIGNNIIEVLVRDKNHAGPSGSDDHNSASFIITPATEHEMQTSSGKPQQQQTSRPMPINASGPVYLSDLRAYHSTFSGINYDLAADLKIGNKGYEKGVQLYECTLDVPVSQFTVYPVAYFNLNGEYSHLTGLIGLDDKTTYNDKIAVYLGFDTDKVIKTFNILPGDLPANIDIDVSGVHRLVVEETTTSCKIYIDLLDMKLQK